MERTAWKLRGFLRRRARFGADYCTIIGTSSIPDGFGGTTEVETELATDVRCFYVALGQPMQRQIGGGPITTLTHKIIMEATSATKLIKPDYQIVVEARNGKPELTFETPVTLDGSFTPLVEVAAVLTE